MIAGFIIEEYQGEDRWQEVKNEGLKVQDVEDNLWAQASGVNNNNNWAAFRCTDHMTIKRAV